MSAVLSDFAQLISSMILTLYYRTGNGLAGTHSGADVIVLQGGVSVIRTPRASIKLRATFALRAPCVNTMLQPLSSRLPSGRATDDQAEHHPDV